MLPKRLASPLLYPHLRLLRTRSQFGVSDKGTNLQVGETLVLLSSRSYGSTEFDP